MSKILFKNLLAAAFHCVLSVILLRYNIWWYVIDVIFTVLIFVSYSVANSLLPEYTSKITGTHSDKAFRVSIQRTALGNILGIILYCILFGN